MSELRIPRDYQKNLVKQAAVALKKDKWVIVQSPTGSGKSFMMLIITEGGLKKGKTFLVLTESKKIFNQLSNEFGAVRINAKTNYFVMRKNNVYVAMSQSLANRPKILQQFLDLGDDLILIIDEAHIGTTRKVIELFPGNRLGFTATPASTSTITMAVDLTAKIKVNMGLMYIIGGVTYYGQVSAITNNLLSVRGAPLGGDVTSLYYGGGFIRQLNIIIPGLYEDASNTALIASDLGSSFIWTLPISYCVHYKVYSKVHDTGTHGQASVRINNTEVNTTAGGLTIAADTTWYSTVVDIATAAYDINPGEAIEVTSVKSGNGDATDLTVTMIFLTP